MEERWNTGRRRGADHESHSQVLYCLLQNEFDIKIKKVKCVVITTDLISGKWYSMREKEIAQAPMMQIGVMHKILL